MKPHVTYGLCADVHLHNWSFGSHINEHGVNNRLQYLLDDLYRCAEMTIDRGGDAMVIAGDLFHVRGSVAPSVLNPAKAMIERILHDMPAMTIYILAGNHDMEFRDSSAVGNSVQALAGERVVVINSPRYVSQLGAFLVPWVEDMAELKSLISHEIPIGAFSTGVNIKDCDLILHAPIDGVIGGLPPHGLTPEWLGECGYNRIFAGHYHNHKRLGHEVYSIGALAHHTWNDVNTDAGFLMVGESVEFMASHAPRFFDVKAEDFDDDTMMALAVVNTYCRVKLPKTRAWEQEEIRNGLLKMGARAVTFNVVKERILEREDGAVSVSASVAAGASVETSVAEYIKSKSDYSTNAAAITAAAIKVLAEVA